MTNPFRHKPDTDYKTYAQNHSLCMHLCVNYLKEYAEDLAEAPDKRKNLLTELLEHAGPLPAGQVPGGAAWIRWFLHKKVPEMMEEKDVPER